MDGGLLVETLETAATWTALPTVYDAVRRALRESLTRDGRRPLIMSHVSHGYPTGASLYVTVLADRDDDLPIQQWLTAKRAATDALLGAGGTLTHHHAVGADHRPWMEREIGPLGVEVLRAVKAAAGPARASATPASCCPTDRSAPTSQKAWPKEKMPAGSTVALTSRSRCSVAGG